MFRGIIVTNGLCSNKYLDSFSTYTALYLLCHTVIQGHFVKYANVCVRGIVVSIVIPPFIKATRKSKLKVIDCDMNTCLFMETIRKRFSQTIFGTMSYKSVTR